MLGIFFAAFILIKDGRWKIKIREVEWCLINNIFYWPYLVKWNLNSLDESNFKVQINIINAIYTL